jgi:hydroxyacylglutathione hydrolase
VRDWQKEKPELHILDVRREPEWQAGHIPGAEWAALDDISEQPPHIDLTALVAVHCKSGYRSVIACSLLERAGFQNLVNVTGGFDAWQKADLPFTSEQPVAQ